MTTAAIETVALTRCYGKITALNQLNLHVTNRSIYGFIGPNGAGKTTTLRLLAGLLAPTSGEIHLMGQHLKRDTAEAKWLVGYMPDFFGVYTNIRLWEYLDFFARCYKLSASQRRNTVDRLLELIDLADKRDEFVQNLSRGMQQRLCLAHALVHDPPLLLLDEPASGLDPRARVEFRELLRTLRDMGKTVILSSHILSELAEVCDEIGIIDQGQMVISGTVQEVRRQIQGGVKIHIQTLDDRQAVIEALRAMPTAPNLPEIKAIHIDETQDRSLYVDVEHADENQQTALLSYLLTQGVRISNYHTMIEDLEDLFLRLTNE